MSKLALIIIAVFLSLINHAHASVSISEIMYDLSGTDTDREWVELYNDSGSTVDLDGWKFNDGSNHVLNAPPANGGQGALEISADGYIILAGNATTFLADHPGFSGTVVDTVMSLNNTSDTLSLFDGAGILEDSVTYSIDDGGAGDGNTLQLVGSSWLSGAPTPGAENDISNSATDESENNETSVEEDDDAEINDFLEPSYQAEILSKVIVPIGVPVSFSSLVLNEKEEQLHTGVFDWNLGDGTAYSFSDTSEFFHTYKAPGEYVIVLEYRHKKFSSTPDDTDKLVLKVFDSGVTITGFKADGTVLITNGSKYDIDLSGWALVLEGFKFTFPKNTFLLAGKTFGLSPEQSSLPRILVPGGILYLNFPDDHVATTYSLAPLPVVQTQKFTTSSVSSKSSQLEAPLVSPLILEDITPFGVHNALGASVVSSQNSGDKETKSGEVLYVILLLGIIFISIGSVIYIRNTGTVQSKSPELSAEGYTIREE